MSGELLISPWILVGVWSFTAPKSESLIWSASSFPLASAARLECHNGWWALKSPMMIPWVLRLSNKWLMLVCDPLVQDDAEGM